MAGTAIAAGGSVPATSASEERSLRAPRRPGPRRALPFASHQLLGLLLKRRGRSSLDRLHPFFPHLPHVSRHVSHALTGSPGQDHASRPGRSLSSFTRSRCGSSLLQFRHLDARVVEACAAADVAQGIRRKCVAVRRYSELQHHQPLGTTATPVLTFRSTARTHLISPGSLKSSPGPRPSGFGWRPRRGEGHRGLQVAELAGVELMVFSVAADQRRRIR